jgi:hypothetical protein
METEPHIAVYDDYDCFLWPVNGVPRDELDATLLEADSFRKCKLCNVPLQIVPELSDAVVLDKFPQYVLICPQCGFWFGRGTRGYAEGPAWGRGALGRIRKYPLTSLEIPTNELIKLLNSNHKLLDKIDPFKAEHVVAQLLSDALSCEVHALGGRKDGGVDAYVVTGNQTSTIIQVKWHQCSSKAESVKVIRELAGTLLVRGVPNGILVTTRPRLSRAAKEEAEEVGKREVAGIGRLSMDYKTYADLLSMLEISTRKLSESPKVVADVGKYDLFDYRSR